jgi:CrcB protein
MFDTAFPVGTFLVNVSGSFLLGAIIRYALETPAITPEIRALLTIGVCGGYTTFSTFSYEAVALLEDGEWTRAGMYLFASVLLSLVATVLGFALARQLVVWRQHI